MPVEPRMLAIRGLGRSGTAEVAEELLNDVMGAVYGWLGKAAEIASTLGPQAKKSVRARALELTDDLSTAPSITGIVLKALARLGLTEDVDRLAGPALSNHAVPSGAVRQITESWLTVTASENRRHVAESVAALILERPVGDGQSHMAAGEVLEKFGENEAAVPVARRLLVPGPVNPETVKWAASILVKVYGQQAVAEISGALHASSPRHGPVPRSPSPAAHRPGRARGTRRGGLMGPRAPRQLTLVRQLRRAPRRRLAGGRRSVGGRRRDAADHARPERGGRGPAGRGRGPLRRRSP
ncbi:hypothetical protein [Streptomyces colonosanans]|uniref:Uncharacterized protein n=1 Tax=Streptomyces colonosanans TaxID=1428652 RepID=A0A1S2NWX9_9ACTN|nr:hypothetical protein [Streptomyces colonosanans]OIJ86028.1 hypothetical protein BIV24_27450 [Streptomyces colonosanans]